MRRSPLFFATCLIFSLFGQNTYLGPTSPLQGDPQLIQVQILIKDDLKPGGLQITKVTFNQTEIPLKPRDIDGFRGQGSFQLRPGSYRLAWKANRDRWVWPRSVSHEEIVHLDPRDLWVQITIQGDTATIR